MNNAMEEEFWIVLQIDPEKIVKHSSPGKAGDVALDLGAKDGKNYYVVKTELRVNGDEIFRMKKKTIQQRMEEE